ncbi:MAG: radical SAM protein [Bacteroidota bacterium]
MQRVFGPVPSRRLGLSLGINNVPSPKRCSYACIYCQVGRTAKLTIQPTVLYELDNLFDEVRNRVEEIQARGQKIDYITFVADGEPTLDINLGREIEILKPIGLPIAVISNSSLVYQQNVRERLMLADWVSLKIDAVSEDVWRQVNRPHGQLKLSAILEGVLAFSESYKGFLATETMLVKDFNDDVEELQKIADFLKNIEPKKSYISIPTRPPTEDWVSPPNEKALNIAYQIFQSRIENVEYLIGYEGDAFGVTEGIEDDILGITSVHPLRDDALTNILSRSGLDWSLVERLIAEEKLTQTSYRGHKFYLRKVQPAHVSNETHKDKHIQDIGE